MFLTYLVLAVALCLSGIAAFYSIAGLAAIFAAAAVPIMIMGAVLEVAKLAVTVWLHEYWHRVSWVMKVYLVPAVALLMVITSMGIFGFLSKAHLDQAVPTSDVAAQVDLLDEKIRTQRDNITAARAALQQMDSQVDQRLSRSSDDRGAERAVQIRRQQQVERAKLQKEIANAQAAIAQLNEQRAPVASELRKVEAEVGPIKYIAALIYGDDPDVNILEKAVRWVIIVLVVVFDPLAVMMLLSFTESYRWERERQRDAGRVADSPESPESPAAVIDSDPTQEQPVDTRSVSAAQEITHAYLDQPWKHRVPGVETVGPLVYTPPDPDPDVHTLLPDSVLPVAEVDNVADIAEVDDDDADHSDADIKEAMRLWKHANPDKTLKDQRQRFEQGLIDQLPWMSLIAADADHEIGFGVKFPDTPQRGDSWMRVDSVPNVLYRYNGQQWIEIDKTIADRYVFNDHYIDYLIDQIDRGEYDPDLLTAAEAEQIAHRLDQKNE